MSGFNLGDGIASYVSNLERDNPELSMSARVKAAWNATAEEAVKPHVMAVFVVPNTQSREVIIYVDTQIWATELAMQSEMLRLRLNIKLKEFNDTQGNLVQFSRPQDGAEQITKLMFRVSKEKYTSRARERSAYEQLEEQDARLKSVQPAALDDEVLAQIQDATAGIENDAIRFAAYRAATANLSWQKGLEQAKIS